MSDGGGSSSSSSDEEAAEVVATPPPTLPLARGPTRGGAGGYRSAAASSSFSFGWSWRQNRRRATAAAVVAKTPPSQQTRKFYVCDATTGKRFPERQEIVVANPCQHSRLRIVSLADNVVVAVAAGDVTLPQPSDFIMAAGVLFYAIAPQTQERLFLIGKEQSFAGWHDSEKWADFGGGVDVADEDVAGTAARESYEETMGVIQTRETLLNRLHNDEATAVLDIQTPQSSGSYRMYLLRVPYHDYNVMLNRFRSYLRSHKLHILDAEKTALEWVSVATLLSTTSFLYRETFSLAVAEISRLIDFASLP